MISSNTRNTLATGTVMAAAAALGGYIVYQNRKSISARVWRCKLKKYVHATPPQVVVVDSHESWKKIEKDLITKSKDVGCVGFDCEWVSGGGVQHPVALIQLATYTGLCVLIRLCKLPSIPPELLELLKDPNVLKVGVGPAEDCKFLQRDYGIVVNGILDLRGFFAKVPDANQQSKKSKKKKNDKNANKEKATAAKAIASNAIAKVNFEKKSIISIDSDRPSMKDNCNTSSNFDVERSIGKMEEMSSRQSISKSNPPDASSDYSEGLTSSTPINNPEANSDANSNPCSSSEASSNMNSFTSLVNNSTSIACSENADYTLSDSINSSAINNPDSSISQPDSTNSSPNNNPDSSISKPDSTNSAAINNPDSSISQPDSTNSSATSNPAKEMDINKPELWKFSLLKGPKKLGLSGLTEYYLGRTLDKDWRIRASDWEADHLTHRQITYAAEDARSGVHVFLVIVNTLVNTMNLTQNISLMSNLCSWSSVTKHFISGIARSLVCHSPTEGWEDNTEKKYSKLANSQNNNHQSKQKSYRRAYSLRKSPLYHNSVLWAPDNEPLCTVDPKKAYWYVAQKLGEVVQEDPLIVRLNFEPTGRPQKEGSDGYFYLNERQNVCVVCGKDDSYIRKNVVPHEYRKHFPEILKSHQNHDVVLLCTVCHQLSNQRDGKLRYKLADEHDAPIGNTTDIKVTLNGNLRTIKSAGKALLKNDCKIPEARVLELRQTLETHFHPQPLTEELITKAAELDVSIMNETYEPHGLRVYKYYERIGLIQLERLWRENFLETMDPKYMPTGWSVTHNHEKLELKMSRHDYDDPVREHYKIALVGTEGEIDVPYVPQPKRKKDLVRSNSIAVDSDSNALMEEDEGEDSSEEVSEISGIEFGIESDEIKHEIGDSVENYPPLRN